jgi:hypothetical protein
MLIATRLILLVFFSVILVTQYQNCSNYSDNTLFGNTLSSSDDLGNDPGVAALRVNNQSDSVAASNEDQMSFGGTCYTAGKSNNVIQYTLTDQALNPVNISGNSTPQYTLMDSRCENGRFYILVHLNNPNVNGPNPANTQYDLHVKLTAWNDQTDAQKAEDLFHLTIMPSL